MPTEKRTSAGYEKKKEYIRNYHKEKYKRIPLDVSIEKYNQIKSASESVGETVNGYIKTAIDARLESDK